MTAHGGDQSAYVRAAFGAKNRSRLIDLYFGSADGQGARGWWEHVYRLLMWTDQTTGLAHCYESDKSQPGKHWYGRTLAFHEWLSGELDVAPSALAGEIDWLFRRATSDLAAEVLRTERARLVAAERQRQPFLGKGMPKPGEDPGLIGVVREVLGSHLADEVPSEVWQLLVQRVRQYLNLENKRRNLVGEGFEDVVSSVIRRCVDAERLEVRTRSLLHDLPGFNRARSGDKPNKVDIALLRPDRGFRTLITAKWSLRADREKQFASEYAEYVTSESDRRPFEYVFVTNEFDPARLMRACEALAANALMFTRVVHINPAALRATYGAVPEERSMSRVIEYIESGRLIGLDRWLEMISIQ